MTTTTTKTTTPTPTTTDYRGSLRSADQPFSGCFASCSVYLTRRRLSSSQIVAAFKDELEAAGDHEQAKLVVEPAYINERAEAAIVFNAAIVGLGLADCDSFGYIHDGKRIRKIEINSGLFIPFFKAGVRRHHLTVGSSLVANGTGEELLATVERELARCRTSIDDWRDACDERGVDTSFLPDERKICKTLAFGLLETPNKSYHRHHRIISSAPPPTTTVRGTGP